MTAGRSLMLVILGLSVVAILIAAGTALGPVPLPLDRVIGILIHAIWGQDSDPRMSPLTARIVLDLRLPRVLLATLTGAGLAVTGVLLQTATRNDLADPFVFGLSSGASAGAALVISFVGDRFGAWTLPVAVFSGSILSALCVVGLVATQRQ